MKRVYLVMVALISMMMVPAAAMSATTWDASELEVVDLVNLQRSFHGLSALAADDRLQAAAELHSQDMAVNDYFSHTTPSDIDFSVRITDQGYDWTLCAENIAAGYVDAYSVMYGTNNLGLLSDFNKALDSENGGFSSWAEVGQDWTDQIWNAWASYNATTGGGGWMGSEGHRHNILLDGLTDIGVGYFCLEADTGDTNYNHYWTQDFGNEVPLPGTMMMFATGICGLIGLRRSKW